MAVCVCVCLPLNRILKVAQTFGKSNVTFAMSDIHDFEQDLIELNIMADPKQPTVVGRDETNTTFVMSDDFS